MAKWIDPMWAAWTAGIIDGEGTITIVPRLRSDGTCRFNGFLVKLMVGNTDRRMVEKLTELWGGSLIVKHSHRKNRADAHLWCVASANALDVLQAILPYLVTKPEQAKVALALQERMSGGVGFNSGNPHNRRSGLTQAEIEIRSDLYRQMKGLNIKPGVIQWQSAG